MQPDNGSRRLPVMLKRHNGQKANPGVQRTVAKTGAWSDHWLETSRTVAEREAQLKANSAWKPCCGSVSALILVGWIRTLIQEGKNDPQKRKSIYILCFEVLDVLFLRAGGFFCSLDVLHGDLEINVMQVFI